MGQTCFARFANWLDQILPNLTLEKWPLWIMLKLMILIVTAGDNSQVGIYSVMTETSNHVRVLNTVSLNTGENPSKSSPSGIINSFLGAMCIDCKYIILYEQALERWVGVSGQIYESNRALQVVV